MYILEQLARILDRPFFPWKNVLVGFSLGQFILEGLLSLRQYKVLQRKEPPKVLQAEVSLKVFDQSQEYGRAKAKFDFISATYSQIRTLVFVYGDILPKSWGLCGLWLARYFPSRFQGEICQTLLFVFAFSIIRSILSLPLSYYQTFVLEEKFGFNRSTLKPWVTERIMDQALFVVIGTPIIAAVMKIIQKTGHSFFYYLWIFTIFAFIFAITIYPIVIGLRFRISPLEPGELKTGIEALAKKINFPLHQLYVIDGSKLNSHSNAYFYGLPWEMSIVIYDTLIEKSDSEEVIAVLAHELGHWSRSHDAKLLLIAQVRIFYIFALLSAFTNNNSLYQSFGFYKEQPIMIGLFLFSYFVAPMDAISKLLMNILSRKFEFEADYFAQNLRYSKKLAQSLLKLQIQNPSTMDVDWMYASYHYTLPTLTERLGALGWQGGKVTDLKSGDSEKPVNAADRGP